MQIHELVKISNIYPDDYHLSSRVYNMITDGLITQHQSTDILKFGERLSKRIYLSDNFFNIFAHISYKSGFYAYIIDKFLNTFLMRPKRLNLDSSKSETDKSFIKRWERRVRLYGLNNRIIQLNTSQFYYAHVLRKIHQNKEFSLIDKFTTLSHVKNRQNFYFKQDCHLFSCRVWKSERLNFDGKLQDVVKILEQKDADFSWDMIQKY